MKQMIFLKKMDHRYYSVDESMFGHDINGANILVLGIIDNISKDFCIISSNQEI